MKINLVSKLVITFFLALPLQLLADAGDYSDCRLFHVERSKNRNIVCYDVNLTGSSIDSSEPIKVYWINKEERIGARNGLSAIQRKMAFGYKIRSTSSLSAQITINACPDRIIRIEKDAQNYKCFTPINKQDAVLNKIYVKTKDNNSLKVEYVELSGYSLTSGRPINEKIYNN